MAPYAEIAPGVRDWAHGMAKLGDEMAGQDNQRAQFVCPGPGLARWPCGGVEAKCPAQPSRPVAMWALALIPFLCPMAMIKPSPNSTPPKNTPSATAPMPSKTGGRVLCQGCPQFYIHWPYCEAKCPYCDFNVHIAKETVQENLWQEALLADLEGQIQGVDLAPLETIYFGGGTPSLLSPACVADLLNQIQARWPAVSTLNISLEAASDQRRCRQICRFCRRGRSPCFHRCAEPG